MDTALVMVLLFLIGGFTAEIRHEMPARNEYWEASVSKRNRNIKIDRFINYSLAVIFLLFAVFVTIR